MNDSNLLQTPGQVSSESSGEVLRDHLRGMVRQMITDVIGVTCVGLEPRREA